MRETTFRFGILLLEGESKAQLEKLRKKLLAISGVLSVDAEVVRAHVELCIAARFADATEAKKLHRRVMNALIKTATTRVTSATTELADVF